MSIRITLFVFHSWQTIFKCILFVLFLLQLFHLIYRAVDYSNHYPNLIGTYCFTGKTPIGYTENNNNINDTFNIQQCSLKNIDACQHIHNQTLLFRLHWYTGLTSEFNNLIRAFIYAINTHRKFLIDDQHWNYGSFSSFFNISQGHFSPWLPSSSYCSQRKFVHFIHYKSDNNKYIPEHFTVGRDVDGGFTSLGLIMKSSEENNQTFEIKRIVAQYLWKTLNDETKDFIHRHLNDIQINKITYGIHVRRGDKSTEVNPIPLEKYIHGIEYFMKKHPRKDSEHRIYVASDRHDVINELQSLRPDWKFIQLSQTTVQSYGHKQNTFNHLPTHIKLESTRVLLTEIEILSRVKYVVCTFSSNICRFVQIVRKQNPDTVLSLDHGWYPQ